MSLTSLIPVPYRIAILVVLCIALYGTGWVKGATHEQHERELADAQQVVQVAHIQQHQAKITTQVTTQYVDRIREVRIKGDTLIKEVPVYVTQIDDRACVIPDSFGVLWDKDNRAAVPDTTAAANAGPGPPAAGDGDTEAIDPF